MSYDDYNPERIEELVRDAKAMRARVVGEMTSRLFARVASLLRGITRSAATRSGTPRARSGGAHPAPSA